MGVCMYLFLFTSMAWKFICTVCSTDVSRWIVLLQSRKIEQNMKPVENCTRFIFCIIQLLGHYKATWYAMPRSHVKQAEIGTSWGRG